MVLFVKFFEGSNIAECPTFEIKLFTLYIICLFVMLFPILVKKGNSVSKNMV